MVTNTTGLVLHSSDDWCSKSAIYNGVAENKCFNFLSSSGCLKVPVM